MKFKTLMGILWEADGDGMVITDWEMLVDYWSGSFPDVDEDVLNEVKAWSWEDLREDD